MTTEKAGDNPVQQERGPQVGGYRLVTIGESGTMIGITGYHPTTASNRMLIGPRALLYLVGLTLAEIVTVLVDTRWGVIGHAVILAFLVAQAGVNAFQVGLEIDAEHRSVERLRANFLVVLAFVPLIRIVSIAMPLTEFPEWSWYGLIAIPLLAAAWAAARACGYSREELGVRMEWRPLAVAITILVGSSGIGLGYVEYRILHPESLVDELTTLQVLMVSVTLFIGTGFTEELIFRGLLQIAGGELFGFVAGIIYASALFSVLHIGHRSLLNIGYVFLVALAFGAIARRTRSLVGVTIAHGLTNICLFVLFPHLLRAT
jgi:uncharacterized protein